MPILIYGSDFFESFEKLDLLKRITSPYGELGRHPICENDILFLPRLVLGNKNRLSVKIYNNCMSNRTDTEFKLISKIEEILVLVIFYLHKCTFFNTERNSLLLQINISDNPPIVLREYYQVEMKLLFLIQVNLLAFLCLNLVAYVLS
jgi:hypothetical protein